MEAISSSGITADLITTYAGIAIFGVTLFFALIGAIAGLIRGAARQLVRAITIVASVFLSFLAIKISNNALLASLAEKDSAGIREWFDGLVGFFNLQMDNSWMLHLDAESLRLMMQVVISLVIAPLVFVAAFIIISALMLIVYSILQKLLGFSNLDNNAATRLSGALLGFVQGVVVSAILFMPIIGVGNAFTSAVQTLEKEVPDEEVTIAMSEACSYVEPIVDGPAFNVLGVFGAKPIYNGLAKIEIDGKDYRATKLLPDIIVIAAEIEKLESVDMKNITPEDEAVLNRILDTVEDDFFLTKLVSGAIRQFALNYKNGVVTITVQAPYDALLDSAIAIFETTDSTNVHADLDTVVEVLLILSREGVIASLDTNSEALLTTLTSRDENGQNAVNKVIDAVNANPRTKPLVSMLAKLSVTIMSQQAGLGPGTAETYDNIKGSINNDVLSIDKDDYATEEEYVDAVADSLDTVLQQNNITLEPEIVETMAEYISDNFSEVSEITDDDINNIILSYYDAYLDYLENGTVPELP